jgi:hypothetical protein
MSKWVVVDVGCIECGEHTSVVAVCPSKKKAIEALQTYAEKVGEPVYAERIDYFYGGQHQVGLYEVGVKKHGYAR